MATTKWIKPFHNNDYRRTLTIAYIGWFGTAAIVMARVADLIPTNVSSLSFLTLGVAVASSLALSRMRLADTISEVFTVGLQSAITLSANVFTDTCIMMLDDQGRVMGVDHADAIGWNSEELTGRELRALLTPRSHGVRVIKTGTSMTSPMLNQKGETFDARLSFAAVGNEDTMIVTVSPVIAINAEGNYRKV